jgi:20S proteasome alpha/beta subunit
LGNVDLYGNYFIKDYITAGFAKHFALPLIANYWNTSRTEDECKQIIKQCF